MDSIKKNVEITDPKVGNKDNDKGLGKRHKNEVNFLAEKLPKGKRNVLDLGCREGLFLEKLSKSIKWESLSGMDISEKAINYLLEKNKHISTYVGDVHHLSFKDESFNLVTCLHTLEHCDNPSQVMREIYRVLEPGGYCLVEVPIEKTDKPRTTVGHFSVFSRRIELQDLMEEFFTVMEVRDNPHRTKEWFMCLGKKE